MVLQSFLEIIDILKKSIPSQPSPDRQSNKLSPIFEFPGGVKKVTQAKFQALCWVYENILMKRHTKGHILQHSKEACDAVNVTSISPVEKEELCNRAILLGLHKKKLKKSHFKRKEKFPNN